MVSIEDKLNNALVLERFAHLQRENLEPKLAVYGRSRLFIVSQMRTNLFAKIYQLFLDIIYHPILSFFGKLSFDERLITDLTGDIELLKSDLSDKQRVLNGLAIKIEAQKQETDVFKKRITAAKREVERAEKELLEKQQALQECRAAESKIAGLKLQIMHLESIVKDLPILENQYTLAEQRIRKLRETIYQLESQISSLRSDAEQLSYKERCQSLQYNLNLLQLRLAKAEQVKHNEFCWRCRAPMELGI